MVVRMTSLSLFVPSTLNPSFFCRIVATDGTAFDLECPTRKIKWRIPRAPRGNCLVVVLRANRYPGRTLNSILRILCQLSPLFLSTTRAAGGGVVLQSGTGSAKDMTRLKRNEIEPNMQIVHENGALPRCGNTTLLALSKARSVPPSPLHFM